MKELITMWKNTRMIVLTAVSAAVYAAVLIPFKVAIPLIPGFTEVRPANVLPIICSLMFGPAAAWGSAIGNTIADAFGTFGIGTAFGFVGNFLYGFIPYKIWQAFGKGEPVARTYRSSTKSLIIALVAGLITALVVWAITHYVMESSAIYIIVVSAIAVFLVLRFLSVEYFLIILSASAACGVFIGWGVHVLGLVPFSALGNIIVINNFLASAVLGPILLPILYPVVKRMGLLYTDIMEETDLSRPRKWGSLLMMSAVICGLVIGNQLAIGGYDMGILGAGFGQAVAGRVGLGLGLLPLILLIFVAAAVM